MLPYRVMDINRLMITADKKYRLQLVMTGITCIHSDILGLTQDDFQVLIFRVMWQSNHPTPIN
ncbi:MAG: hypothetical protein GX176_05345 [Syntrophomonadaceae bacterium]|nr:hypothetical protein [Syntrophomonadaceae bacterium]